MFIFFINMTKFELFFKLKAFGAGEAEWGSGEGKRPVGCRWRIKFVGRAVRRDLRGVGDDGKVVGEERLGS